MISTLGTYLQEASYTHPIYPEKTCPVLPATHVTSESGTGLVHTAPAHGPEDYDIARKHDIQIVIVVSSKRYVTQNSRNLTPFGSFT